MKYILIAWIVTSLGGDTATATFEPVTFDSRQQCNTAKTAMLKYNPPVFHRPTVLYAECVAAGKQR